MYSSVVFSRADLLARGKTWRQIASDVAGGDLVRLRRDCYVPEGTPEVVMRALRVGGRLTCVSLLQEMGIFVHTNDRLHVQVPPNSARLRTPGNAARRLRVRQQDTTVVHWTDSPAGESGGACVPIIHALAHSVRCQTPRNAIATMDSALNGGHIQPEDLDAVFELLPPRFQSLRSLVDARAQSGTETLVRLIVRSLGCVVELQVRFDGVGYVDMVIDGWLAIECDSRQFHGDWKAHANDRRRDAALAALGIHTLRFAAATILNHPDVVIAAVRGVRAARDRLLQGAQA